jgi:two-component system phosphate regulon sensor histidine kinase PhoR
MPGWLDKLLARAEFPFGPSRREPNAPIAPQPSRPRPRDDHVGIEALPGPAMLIDARMVLTSANAAARALLGERMLGEDVRIGLRHPAIIDVITAARDDGTAAERELAGFGRPENVFRLRAVALGDGRVLLTVADITQARLTERMRVDFVANASHELRTPLATILGFIETLQGPAAEDEPARARFLEIMAREAQRMARLIEDLLSLSQIELDKYVAPRTEIPLPVLVADVGKTLAVRLEGDCRVLDCDLPQDLPTVVADRDQILQVLHNLISNALKYGRTGTPIRVSAEVVPPRAGRDEAQVRVSVEDEGEGIAPEHLPRLTERFYRVDTSRSRAVGGTGLGLAIVKHIVERHRGTLAILSKPGEGTVVSFTLPQAPPFAAEPTLAAAVTPS